MFKQYKKMVYAAAITVGLVGMAVSAWGESIFIAGLVYFLLGAIFGFFWPREGWRWGLCISLPIVGLLGLSFLFAGFVGDNKNDIYFLLAIVIGSTAESFTGSFVGRKSKTVR